MDKILGKVRAAVDKYNMIEPGDCIAVGVSGGKDSVTLLYALRILSDFYPKKFTVKAITADPCFGNEETDFSAVESFCRKIGVEYTVRRTSLYDIVFNKRREKSPCSMCARMRRGILHNMAKESACNKIALGHNMDDAAETLLINLFDGGKIGCFSPVTYLSRKDITMIRPLIFLTEKEILNAVNRNDLPTVKSACPKDGASERQNVKEIIASLGKTYPDIKSKLTGALERGNISGW